MMTSLWQTVQSVVVVVVLAQTVIPVAGQGSDATCERCENDPQSCRRIAGLYTMSVLKTGGYHPVVDLPVHACHINLTELAPSKNYLAVKTSRGDNILNTYWSVGAAARVPGAGTAFNFRRGGQQCPGQCITAPGPTNQALVVQLLYFDKNPGIAYSFVIPNDVAFQPFEHRLDPGASHSRTRPSAPEPRENPTGPRRIIPRTSSSRQHLNRYRAAAAAAAAGGESDQERINNVNARVTNALRQRGPARVPESPPSAVNRQAVSNNNNNNNNNNNPVDGNNIYQGRSYGSHTLGGHGQSYSYQYPNSSSSSRSSSSSSRSSSGQSSEPVLISNRRRIPSGRRDNQYTPSRGSLIRSRGRYDVSRVRGGSYSSSRRPSQSRPSLNRRPILRRKPSPTRRQPHSPSIVSAYDTEAARGLGSSGRGGLVDRTFARGLQVDQRLQPGLDTRVPQRPALSIARGGGGKGYEWTISGLSECSQTCGGGVQETEVVCVLTSSGRQVVVTPDNCLSASKPRQQRLPCNNDPCPPAWETGEWSECSVTCGGGTQTRRAECRQKLSDSLELSVSASQCNQNDKPAVAQQCNNDPCAHWKEGQWDECSLECGGGERRREVDCVDAQGVQIPASFCPADKPPEVERCNSQPCNTRWWHDHWSDQCSATCGTGITSRHVMCADRRGRAVPDAACESEERPRDQKRCDSGVVCGGVWFAGPWSQCPDSCGRGVRRRQVVCLQKKEGAGGWKAAPPSQCREEGKPPAEEECQRRECGSQYYMTPWTQCSVTCGQGIKTREVRCLDENQQPSSSCDQSRAPKDRESCQLSPCPERRYRVPQSGNSDLSSQTSSFSNSVYIEPPEEDNNSKVAHNRQVAHNHHVSHHRHVARRHHGRRTQHVQAMQDSVSGAEKQEQTTQKSPAKCKDTFWNCRLVVQARLCPHAYYKGVCCATCSTLP